MARTARPKPTVTARPAETAVAKEVAIALAVTQVGVLSVASNLQEDALTDAELGMLARGIAAEILNYNTLLSIYIKLHGLGGPHAQLLGACVAIAAPRLLRRGLLPPPVALAMVTAGAHLSGVTSTNRRSAVSAVAVESGRAFGSEWENRDREEQYVAPPTDLPFPLAPSEDETGQSGLPEGYESIDSQRSNTGIAESEGIQSRTRARVRRQRRDASTSSGDNLQGNE